MDPPVRLALPLTVPCQVQNSPADRVPSHGTHVMATTYAIDLVPVDVHGRRSNVRDWRTALATEPPERFVGFGAAVLAPTGGTVVTAHDGEPDHEARRSQLSLVPYALGQASRLRQGAAALAGNHVVIELPDGRAYAAIVHLRRGSLRVRPGDHVRVGEHLADCGNSGNSTDPHVHLQVMDHADPMVARGLPILLTGYREHRGGRSTVVDAGLAANGSIIEPA